MLVYRECSALVPIPAAPKRPSRRTCVHAGLRTGTRNASLLLAPKASDGASAISSSYAQKFLAELEASGRVLTKRDQKWWTRFGDLEEYKHEQGDCNVPRHYKANQQLATWVKNQRQFYKNNKLASERIEALVGIGFEWARPTGPPPDDANWWTRFGELEEYKQERGDCNVPQHYKANPQLGIWVANQRQFYKNNKLESKRIEALEGIGFEWVRPTGGRPDDANWWKQFRKLEEYKQEHGDCNVSRRYKANPQLATWVASQRKSYQQKRLSTERIEALEDIGFEWTRLTNDANWRKRFGELEEYKATHGHTDVPTSWEDQELFWWVSVQRREYRKLKEGKKAHITEDRIERLDGIGFEWRSKKTYQWKIRFGELRDFYDENGAVPVSQAKHLTLYNWVQRQKKEYDKFVSGEKTNMDEERMKDLESIGFFEVYGN